MKTKCFLLTLLTFFLVSFTSCDKDDKNDMDYWVGKLKLEQTLWEGKYYSELSPKGIVVKLTFLDENRMDYSYENWTCKTNYSRSNRLLSIKQFYGTELLDGDWIIVEANSSGLTLLKNPQSTSGDDSAKLVLKQVW